MHSLQALDAERVSASVQALMFAVQHCTAVPPGNPKLVTMLLNHKCSVTATNRDGQNAVMIACAAPWADALDVLLQHCRKAALSEAMQQEDVYGNSCLHLACRSGNLKACTTLLDAGVILTAQDSPADRRHANTWCKAASLLV